MIENVPGHEEAELLYSKIIQKETSENIIQSLLDIENGKFSKFTEEQKLDIIVHCILRAGTKSLSHLIAFLERSIYYLLFFYFYNKKDILHY